jgi:hypothetical protein
MAFTFTSPVGRMVFGSVWDGRTTDKNGAPRLIKTGPNAGKPLTTWSFGVAVPKLLANGASNAAMDEYRKNVIDVARAGYPQFFTGPIDPFTGKPGCVHPRMSYKIADGDGIDGDGKPNNQKEGWAGHWVIIFSSSHQAPRVFDVNIGLDPAQQLQDKSRVRPGDYVAVNGSCEPNTGSETPGVYMNHSMVCFVSAGVPIVNGPRASEAFAGITAGQLPPGCIPGANPANVAPVPPAAPAAPTPPAPAAVPVAAPAGPALTPAAIAAGFTTYQAAIGAGWTDAALTSAGYLQAAAPVAPTPPAPPAPPVATGPQLNAAAIAAGFSTLPAALEQGWTLDTLRASGFLA